MASRALADARTLPPLPVHRVATAAPALAAPDAPTYAVVAVHLPATEPPKAVVVPIVRLAPLRAISIAPLAVVKHAR